MATFQPGNNFEYNEEEFALTVRATNNRQEVFNQLILFLKQGRLKELRTLRMTGKLAALWRATICCTGLSVVRLWRVVCAECGGCRGEVVCSAEGGGEECRGEGARTVVRPSEVWRSVVL